MSSRERSLFLKPTLEGAPRSADESIFSTPQLVEAADVVVRYQDKDTNSEQRRELVRNLAQELISQPYKLVELLDAIAMLQAVQEGSTYRGASELQTRLLEQLNKVKIEPFPPEPAVIEQWLTISSDSQVYGQMADRVLTGLVERCKDRKTLVNLLFQLASVGLPSSNQKMADKVFLILCGETSVIPADSPKLIELTLANYDLDDDVVKKAMDVDSAVNISGANRHPEAVQRRNDRAIKLISKPEAIQYIRFISEKYPERFNAIAKYYAQAEGEFGTLQVTTNSDSTNKFPLNLIYNNPSQLRMWANEQLATAMEIDSGQPSVSYNFPTGSGVLVGDSNTASFIKKKYAEPVPPEQPPLEARSYWTTLSYLAPAESQTPEMRTKLIERNEKLCNEIRFYTRSLLSPRGDLVEVTDAAVLDLGFTQILYQMDSKNKRDTIITLQVGNYQFRVLLDEQMSLRQLPERINLSLPPDSVFVKHILLSHLREIRCADPAESLDGEKGEGKRMAFSARRAHLRRLPDGKSPTTEQTLRALNDYDIDLVRLNREAQVRGETRKITFVAEVDQAAIGGSEPVRSRQPQALEWLQQTIVSK
ncbi:MAG: hypothetical protein WCV88_06020 [Patescibacteria group bacterium]|jgi:hypothetical protein